MFKITCDTTPDVELLEVVRFNVSCCEASVTELPAPPPQAATSASDANANVYLIKFFIRRLDCVERI